LYKQYYHSLLNNNGDRQVKPYGIFSDPHAHNWSAFSTLNGDGINNRLQFILDEMRRLHIETKKAGGNTIYCGGDLFHVRGSITPSVMNPLKKCFADITADGTEVRLIPGNHDLENKESDAIGNAVHSLSEIEGVIICDRTTYFPDDKVLMVPWHSSQECLMAEIEAQDMIGPEADLIIHAGVNNVIKGIPNTGLEPKDLAALGFRFVFAGHYHDHKHLGGGVYSIGALTHQTWGDVGSKAGFLIVSDDVEWNCTNAPQFIDLDPTMDDVEAQLAVDGHYVRVKLDDATAAEVTQLRETLKDYGALGSLIQASTKKAITRTGSTVDTGKSIEASVGDYVKAKKFTKEAELNKLCANILQKAKERVA
jgi:DNA repair exonuclease SbcCD nuclease subunit